MKKRMTALALLLCLTLAACGGEKEDSRGQASLLGAAAGLDEMEILLTVDGREVPAWRYLYWLAYTCERVRERYQSGHLALDWATPVSGGTLADYVKDQALADTALYATVENWAQEHGCIPEQETQPPRAGALPDMGLGQEQMDELEQVGRQYAALYALYCTRGSALAPSDEALSAYGRELGAVTLDRILIAAGEDKETARQRAEEAFARINGEEDQAEIFSALAAAGDDPAGPRTILPEDAALEPALLEAALVLEEGQCSGILESEEGFSIFRRLPLQADSLKEEYFDHLLQSAAENAAVASTSAYETLDAAAFDAALEQTRRAEQEEGP